MFECNFNVTQCQIPAGWLHIPIGWRLTEANYATTPQIGFISRVILSMQGSAEQFQQIIVKSDLFLSFCRSKCQCFSSFVITGFKGAKHLETDCLPSLPWKNLGQEAREVQFNVIVFLCSAAATKKTSQRNLRVLKFREMKGQDHFFAIWSGCLCAVAEPVGFSWGTN